MKQKSGLLWLVLLLSMSSCVSFENFSIEVFKPAKFTLPPDLQNVAMVQRNLKYKNDTLQSYQVQNQHLVQDKIRFNADSLAQISCIDSLAVHLAAQNRFDSIIVLPASSFPEIRAKEIRPAKAEWYQHISDQTGVDGLIILDMYSGFYTRSDNYQNNSTPNAKVVSSNIWSIYDHNRKKIIDRFIQIDTLYWDGTDEKGNFNKLRIPAKKEAMMISAGVIGENYSKYLVPSWIMVYRDVMTCGQPELKHAASLAHKSKWDDAAAIWQNYADSKNKRNKIISLYNLAVANEMNGNIDQALEFTARAARISTGVFWSMENEAIRKYSAILYRRKIEISKLNAQHELR